MRDKAIRSVVEIAGVVMIEIVGEILDIEDLDGILLKRSSVFMRTAGILVAPGVQGGVAGVEAPQREDPLPVVALRPREVHRQLGILALAKHPQTGVQSTPYARAQSRVGRRCQGTRGWNIWVRWQPRKQPSRRRAFSGITEIFVLYIYD